jgi:TPR repeat protein
MYADGLGVPQDDAEAMRWYRKVAEQGDARGFLEEVKTQAPTLATRKIAYLEAIDRPGLYPPAHALD